ncbi:MAG TPA: sigma-54 dependent transcriptional regulator [Bryobacteraceae bacterium]|nr:sigma-54 dependent transcriptional regulator [Bryobacteraceae bacterium]
MPNLTPKVLWIAEQTVEIVDESRLSLTVVNSAIDGLRSLRNEDFDVVMASFPLADWASAASLLEEIQQTQPATPVVIHAPDASSTEEVRLVKCGAFHVHGHGDATSLLYLAANSKWVRESTEQSASPEQEHWRRFLIGESRAMQRVFETIRLVAPRRSTVLIAGETGTGKEVVARSIHAAGHRAHLPMVCVNCSALPEALLEAELFGHVRGAFTGAMNQRIGRFEQANHSTIFLDEIGDLPLSLQAKLLRVLQEREFQRLGSSETVKVDVRVIAATHAGLAEMVKEGKFREDLYYRLNVVPVAVPPLRERGSDIHVLVEHFMEKICTQEDIAPRQISRETLDRLAAHDWPGNVRQLENAVEKAIVMSGERRLLFPGDFPLPARQHPIVFPGGAQAFIPLPDHGLDFERTVGSIELNILEQALKKTGGNKKLAAAMLGLKRTTLAAKLKSLVAVGAA